MSAEVSQEQAQVSVENESVEEHKTGSIKILLGIGLLAAWSTFPLFFPLGGVVWLCGTVYLMYRKRRLGWLSVGLSPYVLLPIFVALFAIAGYASGTAKMKYSGYPSPEFWNLDRDLRVYASTSGCVVDGSEIFTQIPNNIVLSGLLKLFGPMPRSYQGPYPTRKEAGRLLAKAKTLPAHALSDGLKKGQIALKGRSLRLTTSTLRGLTYALKRAQTRHKEKKKEQKAASKAPMPIRAAIYQKRVLLLLLGEWVYLIDVAKGEKFAVFMRGWKQA